MSRLYLGNQHSGSYEPSLGYGKQCTSHAPGTTILGIGKIALGLPKGFCRVEGATVRLIGKEIEFPYDNLNVPVWAMEIEEDGISYLVVRCYQPRIDKTTVDVWEGKLFRDLPLNPINVVEFVDDID